MFGISGGHLLIIAIVVLILGPDRIPLVARTLGKAMKSFRDALGGIQEAQFRHIHKEDPIGESSYNKNDTKHQEQIAKSPPEKEPKNLEQETS